MKKLKKLLAVVLTLSMLLSFVACGNSNSEKSTNGDVNITPNDVQSNEISFDEVQDLALEDPEAVINILDKDIDTSKLSEKELTDLATNLLEGLNKKEEQSLNVNDNKDAYDENGAMTKPFDEVYPEAIEDEIVEYSDETILVKMSNTKNGRITLGMFAAGVAKLEAIVPLENETWYKASLRKGTDTQKALENLRELKEIILAEYDYKIKTAAIDEYQDIDSAFGIDCNGKAKDQWYLNHCGIPDSFKYIKNLGGSSSVVVAVIDTGVDIDHEDLSHNIWKNTKEIPDNGIDDDRNGYVDDYYGVNLVSGRGNGDDDNGHGTHVAGIIAAQNNHIGTIGIAYKTTIMPIKAAAASGYFLQSDIAKAVLYAYENGAEVINMSFGGSSCSIAVQDALATAYTRCVLVASAGNSGAPNEGLFALPNYPAALTYVLGVMAVDPFGRETYFTNWDNVAFNGVEYELYAPGFNIMSTLPNNTYGSLSGTSMAAPVVSAMAAILRCEFSDRDTYPTKFIYGQLASTSEISADCYDPEEHGKHNLPQIADLYSALTKLPKPDIGVQDFLLFDTEGLAEDTANANNGDGVIDAGETIALGLTLRNRWGKSEDTYVTLDTESLAGISDPYVTFVNPTVNYGSVGTYSTQDCGRIFTDELLTGWENPFIIKIAKDCPNDYIVKVNVNLSYKNGLDKTDKATYTSSGSFILTIRNGVVLPTIIEEDMVLTPDNLYIIPNSTVITEGTTVTVRPGTNIQFWTDDPKDPYADSYIASLLVEGNFLVEGTKENPVNIFPSDLMDRYTVDMGEGDHGYISLKYADITNPRRYDNSNNENISYVDHCTFRMNYGDYIRFRRLDSGKVSDSAYYGIFLPTFTLIKDSVFYKIGMTGSSSYFYGNAQRCIFADCGIEFSNYNSTTQNCVFLGNTFLDQTDPNYPRNSSLQITDATILEKIDDYDFSFYYREDTGTTYVRCDTGTGIKEQKELAEIISKISGGNFAKFETLEELEWLYRNVISRDDIYYIGNLKGENGEFLWYDGTPVDKAFFSDSSAKASRNNYLRYGSFYGITSTYTSYSLFEIPGKILPTEITFREYEVNIDKDTTYQIAPLNTPIQLDTDAFIYEVTDENVVTVSDTGLVTPVGNGTTEVFVFSEDRAVYNYITFTVLDYVPLEDFEFSYDADVVGVGESLVPSVAFTPADTTRKNVTYTSSDPSVIKVDPYSGIATGVSSGTATITATCEGISHTFELKSILKATSLEFKNISVTLSLSEGEENLPEVITNEGAETDLSWRSVDETVVKTENGKLVPVAAGSSTLVVTDKNSGLSATCLVFVGESKLSPVKKSEKSNNYSNFVLLENGDLYFWNNGTRSIPEIIDSDVLDISLNGRDSSSSYCYALHNDGTINQWYAYNGNSGFYLNDTITHFEDRDDIEAIFAATSEQSIFVTTSGGSIYAWGNNSKGQLGDGTTSYVSTPVLLNLENVVDVKSTGSRTVFLTEDNKIYYSGNGKKIPTLLAEDAEKLLAVSSDYVNYLNSSNEIIRISYSSEIYLTHKLNIAFDYLSSDNYTSPYYYGIGIKDGNAYYINTYNYAITLISGIDNAAYAYTNNGTHYIVTEDGELLGYGANSKSDPFIGITSDSNLEKPEPLPLNRVKENLVVTSHEQQGDKYKITFNKQINGIAPKLYADGTQYAVSYEINNLNELVIWRTKGFSENVEYQLVLGAGTTECPAGITNSEDITIDFTYTEPSETPDSPETPDAPEASEEKVVHESITDSTIERLLNKTSFINKLKDFQEKNQFNPNFFGNAMLNRLSTDTNVEHWLRILASNNSGQKIPLGGNWWGTTNETAIGLQLIDYSDFISYGRFMYEPYLTSAPEDTFPFVTSVKILNNKGEEVSVVGNEQITVQVTFNRDMDTSIPLQVRFGSAYPYGDYEIEGEYVNPRTWEGKYKLSTIIENGIQYFTIENGCSATDDLKLMRDRARFTFEIDTTAAQALIMRGEATDTGINLTWTQDDFDTLMGYNVYRSTAEDGLYVRVNQTVIPAETMEFFDDTVEPGVQYYYNFTVVQTDLSESDPSGKISIMSKDTMAPAIYHSPVYNATTGANLVISATVTDNLNISYARVYYRINGEDEWRVAVMNNLNDKYSAIIIADHITTEGLEYYIEAFDGVSYTYKGTADAPYFITVQEAVSKDALGDVNGDGLITNLDALMLLKAINDQINLTPEEFARADLDGNGELAAKEALCILQYVSGAIGSVDMREANA